MVQPLWKIVLTVLKKTKNRITIRSNNTTTGHISGKDENSNLKRYMQYDPGIPLLGIYLEKIIIQKDTCTPLFIVALFTIARSWKQPKGPSTEEWIKKM